MLFVAPGQTGGESTTGGQTLNPKGLALMFHPDLLYGTPLASRITDYTFFSYDPNEALHMSEREKRIILNCFREIGAELEHAIDKHTEQIIASTIETMLNYCTRFDDRQFITRNVRLGGMPVAQLFRGSHQERAGQDRPRIHTAAEVIGRAKELIADNELTISEIAYELGFKYPHHLARVFKQVTGITHSDYRLQVS